jgi:Domain of unknown function (DUF5753)/Helix-turn-helix domain
MAVGTTRGKRRLGRYVKPIVDRSGLKPEQVAKLARCSKQSVYRLLSGDALPRIYLLGTILGVIEATPEERDRAVQLWEIADAGTATIEHAEDLPVKYRRFRMDEGEASRERTLDTVIVPGMLQTADYASAISYGARRLIRADGWQSRAAAERSDRQGLLVRNENPLVYHGLIAEGALRNIIGGPDVMAAQLDHLLARTELPHVTIQVIPSDFGAHGLMSGPLFLLSFPEDDEPHAAYVESLTGMETVEDREAAAALSDVWDEIAAGAPSPERSTEMIREIRDTVKG